MARTAWIPLLSLMLAGIGCGQQAESHAQIGPETTPTIAAATEPPANPGADEGSVALEKVNFDTFLKRLASNPSKPRYTIVDAWATWCGPCKENLPHVVAMHKKYAAKGLAVATMSFDDATNPKQVDEALAFLRGIKATFPNYLLDEGDNAGFDKFNVNGIPAVFLYGPDGKEVKRFTMDDPNNQFTYEEVEKEVDTLLAGK